MNYYDPPEPSWVGEMNMTCEEEVVVVVVEAFRKEVSALNDALVAGIPHRIGQTTDALLAAIEKAETFEATCPWDEKVEVYIMHNRLYWTCPVCKTEHEDDPPEPDPDAIRDMLMEMEYDRMKDEGEL